jgi:protein TonB
LADTTARRLAEAQEVRIVENAIRADLPKVFQADARRVMGRASTIASQAEEQRSENTGTKDEGGSNSSTDASPNGDSSESDGQVYMVVEEQPRIVGGRARLQEAIQYPKEARQKGIEGRVIVRFVVNEQGQAEDLEVVRGAHELLNSEALRAIREMDFKPGRQRGEVVKTQMALSVPFRIQDEG